jgi:hypothetical protein
MSRQRFLIAESLSTDKSPSMAIRRRLPWHMTPANQIHARIACYVNKSWRQRRTKNNVLAPAVDLLRGKQRYPVLGDSRGVNTDARTDKDRSVLADLEEVDKSAYQPATGRQVNMRDNR